MNLICRSSTFVVVIVALGSAGCNSRPVFAPASGIVLTSDGKPLTAGVVSVEFVPLEDPRGFGRTYGTLPFALLDKDGKFTMDLGDAAGVPPGKYRVRLQLLENDTDLALPKRYSDRADSPWEVTVPRNGKTDILLRIEN